MAEPTTTSTTAEAPAPTQPQDGNPAQAPEEAPIPSPIITTSRFIIRPYHLSDAQPMALLFNTPGIARYMRNTFPYPYTLADAEWWINMVLKPDAPHKAFGIFVPEETSSSDSASETTTPTGQPQKYVLAGSIGLQPYADVESRTWNLGYVLGENYWGRGIATEATISFSRWALGHYPEDQLTRLEGGVFEGNTASIKVLTKAGFVSEGVRRKCVWKNGQNLDLHVFGMLRGDVGL